MTTVKQGTQVATVAHNRTVNIKTSVAHPPFSVCPDNRDELMQKGWVQRRLHSNKMLRLLDC